jgi:hypothetical protein
MNRNPLVPGVPDSLEEAFRHTDPTEEGAHFRLERVAFTHVEVQFIRDFLQQHPRAFYSVLFNSCTFDDSDECLTILHDCFMAAVVAMPEMRVSARLQRRCYEPDHYLNNPQWKKLCTSIIHASWFAQLCGFITTLSMDVFNMGDANFKKVVDIILESGNAKNNLKRLDVCYNNLSSDSLVDASRLIEQSRLQQLIMNDNKGDAKHEGLLNNLVKTQRFMESVQKKFVELNLGSCVRGGRNVNTTSTGNANVAMMEKVLQVHNTTLTDVNLDLHYLRQPTTSPLDLTYQHRLAVWTRRNKRLATVLAGVKDLLLHDANNNNNHHAQDEEHGHIVIAGESKWHRILTAAMEDVERDRSALYLLMRQAIVSSNGNHEGGGRGGEAACPLH